MFNNFYKSIPALPQVPHLPPGQFNFRWGSLLGEGGLGRVHEVIVTESNAVDFPVGSRHAGKRLNDNFKHQPEARERFEREIQVLEGMSHPSIMTVRGQNLSGGNERFYLMRLYPNGLRKLLSTAPKGFPWAQAAAFGAQVADAMAYAHGKGFIHRDLKPENILLAENNEPIIADWGLGYFVHKNSKVLQHLTRGGMGTEYYCSMEQWNTGKCDATGDIYSLGMMLAELVCGHQVPMVLPGYSGTGIGVDVVHNNTLGSRLFNVTIKKMTDITPTSRHQTMAEVAENLRLAVAVANTPAK